MKTIFFIILTLTIFSCNEKNINITNNNLNNCECEKTIKSDSIFFATNILSKKENNQIVLLFNCATIETAIASISDLNGNNERCENIYDIKCISNLKKELNLSPNFSYHSDEMRNMDLTAKGAEDLFFEDIMNNKKIFFEFNVNQEKEIYAISKLNSEPN